MARYIEGIDTLAVGRTGNEWEMRRQQNEGNGTYQALTLLPVNGSLGLHGGHEYWLGESWRKTQIRRRLDEGLVVTPAAEERLFLHGGQPLSARRIFFRHRQLSSTTTPAPNINGADVIIFWREDYISWPLASLMLFLIPPLSTPCRFWRGIDFSPAPTD